MEFRIETLSPIWTGGIDGNTSRHFRNSGLTGSLRWWYEITLRALGGYACSPVNYACPGDDKARCAACNMFGCTGWGRKFKLRVTHENGTMVKDALLKGRTYLWEFIFLRETADWEKWLLHSLITKVIAPYGSVGGKMPNKPTESPRSSKRNAKHHKDYGLFQVTDTPDEIRTFHFTKEMIKEQIAPFIVHKAENLQGNHSDWPLLSHLFCVKADFGNKCFDRLEINKFIGVKPDNPSAVGYCLHASGKGVSKKIFSFNRDRVWGYCTDDKQRKKIITEIANIIGKYPGAKVTEEIEGSAFVDKLFEQECK